MTCVPSEAAESVPSGSRKGARGRALAIASRPMPPLSLAPCPTPTTPSPLARAAVHLAEPQAPVADGRTPRLKGAWCAKVLTLFPETFPGVLGASLTGKALQQGLWALETIDLRTFGKGKHRQVDDTPAGGGAGLVMRPDVLGRALDMAATGTPDDPARWPRVYLSPRGAPFTQGPCTGGLRRPRARRCSAAASKAWTSG
jgi:hypothetical protein